MSQNSAQDDRARRLAAIEARLRPITQTDIDPTSSNEIAPSPNVNPLFAPPRHLVKPWTRPNEQDQRKRRQELSRMLQRTVVRDSGYVQAAECVETLLKIATNIQTTPDDEKYRALKSSNNVMRNKVLAVPGGKEFLIAMGFHTEIRDFNQYFVLDLSERRLYELEFAAGILREQLPALLARATQMSASKTAAKSDEAARKAAALRQIDSDRETVRDRAERERIGREAREKALREATVDIYESTSAIDPYGGSDDDCSVRSGDFSQAVGGHQLGSS